MVRNPLKLYWVCSINELSCHLRDVIVWFQNQVELALCLFTILREIRNWVIKCSVGQNHKLLVLWMFVQKLKFQPFLTQTKYSRTIGTRLAVPSLVTSS